MAFRIFDEKQVEQIRMDRKKGATMRQLAKKYFCSLGTIQQVLHCRGAYSQKQTG